jgi:hypothetical protein
MFMNVALIFKYIYQSYGDMQTAADIANRVFYANAAPMLIASSLRSRADRRHALMVWRRSFR